MAHQMHPSQPTYSGTSVEPEDPIGNLRCRLPRASAFTLGLYGTANLFQGIDLPAKDLLLLATFGLLPVLGLFTVINLPLVLNSLRTTWPILLLGIALVPTFLIEGYLPTAVATPERVLILIILPMLLAAALFRERRQADYLMVGIATGACVIAMGLLFSPAVADVNQASATAAGIDTISTGMACAVGAVIFTGWAFRMVVDGRRRLSALVFVAVALALAYFTATSQSRQASLALVLGLLMLPLVLPTKRRISRPIFLALGAFVMVGVLAFGVNEGRFGRTLEGDRLLLWEGLPSTIVENLSGVGWGNYPLFLPDATTLGARYPHNILLQSFLEGGILFGSVLVVCLIVAFVKGWRSRRFPEVAMVTVVFAMFFLSALVSSDITGGRALAVCAGALFGLGAAAGQWQPPGTEPAAPGKQALGA